MKKHLFMAIFRVQMILNIFRKQKPDGIGLYRTEFLFLSREEAPTEEEQCEAYSQVVEGMKGLPVTFRTIDIGGDKRLSYMDLGHEDNPFWGIELFDSV